LLGYNITFGCLLLYKLEFDMDGAVRQVELYRDILDGGTYKIKIETPLNKIGTGFSYLKNIG
jgi:hypothetical protein